MHGTRDGSTVNTVLVVFTAVVLVFIAIGVHSLQAWLEQWDHRRHFED